MIATTVTSPITGVDYLWPRALQKIDITDQRRVSLQHVPNADGAQDHYGLNPFPRSEAMVTISFRVTPRASGTTFDALRTKLNLAVDHGLPQILRFADDGGGTWRAIGKLTAKNLSVDNNQQWWADWSVTFVVEDPLAYGSLDGVQAWGAPGLKWGAPGLKWGTSPIPLTTATVSHLLENATATAYTADPVFDFRGQWGPAGLAAGESFSVENSDIVDLGTGAPIRFDVYDVLPAGSVYQIDCGASTVYRDHNPVIGTLVKPSLQYGIMRFKPGDNNLVFRINGAPTSPLTGLLDLTWRPKRSLS